MWLLTKAEYILRANDAYASIEQGKEMTWLCMYMFAVFGKETRKETSNNKSLISKLILLSYHAWECQIFVFKHSAYTEKIIFWWRKRNYQVVIKRCRYTYSRDLIEQKTTRYLGHTTELYLKLMWLKPENISIYPSNFFS